MGHINQHRRLLILFDANAWWANGMTLHGVKGFTSHRFLAVLKIQDSVKRKRILLQFSYLPDKRNNRDATDCWEPRCSFPWWHDCSQYTWVQTYQSSRYDNKVFHLSHGNHHRQTGFRTGHRKSVPYAKFCQGRSRISETKFIFVFIFFIIDWSHTHSQIICALYPAVLATRSSPQISCWEGGKVVVAVAMMIAQESRHLHPKLDRYNRRSVGWTNYGSQVRSMGNHRARKSF